ncbi:MAG: hypothetical protein WDW38_001334 [Sanguina aurantia]
MKVLLWIVVWLNIIFSLYANIPAGSSTEAFKNAMLAACLMGFLVVVAFCAMCLVTLILRLQGAWRGYLLAASLHSGFFMLLAALVLHSSLDVMLH